MAPASVGVNYAVKLAVRKAASAAAAVATARRGPERAVLSVGSRDLVVRFGDGHGPDRPARERRSSGSPALCLTRPYLGMHYPSDVLGGIALGLLIGRLWPGVAAKDVEDRLIDLVAETARQSANGDGIDARRSAAPIKPDASTLGQGS